MDGEGPQELKPLIISLKEFYKGIIDLKENKNVFSVDSIAIRRELFKLNYMS